MSYLKVQYAELYKALKQIHLKKQKQRALSEAQNPRPKLSKEKLKNIQNPHIFHQAQKGLYDGKVIQFGNRITFSNKKTRRTWKPNTVRKQVYSDLLEKKLKIRMTTSVLRTIDKKGGIDNYILYTRDKDIGSKFGLELKEEMKMAFEKKTGKKFDAKQILLDERTKGILRPNFCKAALMSEEELNKWAEKNKPRINSFESKNRLLFPQGLKVALKQKEERDRMRKVATAKDSPDNTELEKPTTTAKVNPSDTPQTTQKKSLDDLD